MCAMTKLRQLTTCWGCEPMCKCNLETCEVIESPNAIVTICGDGEIIDCPECGCSESVFERNSDEETDDKADSLNEFLLWGL